MTLTEAVAQILEAAGNPLHYRKLTAELLERGLWKSQGKTPEATVNARLAVDIKEKAEGSLFQRTAPGTFGLRAWGLPEHRAGRAQRQVIAEDQVTTGILGAGLASVMSFTNAAAHVLEHHGNEQAMHYREITEQALELGLVKTEGKTPAATLYAQVLTEIKRQQLRGETPRFVKQGRGYISLSKWMGTGLAYDIAQHNHEVRQKFLAQLRAMPPQDFEGLIEELLPALGFEEVELTPYAKDGGIDVRGTLVVGDVIRTRMAVQVKRWRGNVGSTVVQQVRGSLGTHEQGLIITTSSFTKTARVEAERQDAVPVGLMDGRQLVDLLIENDIGVKRSQYDLIELVED